MDNVFYGPRLLSEEDIPGSSLCGRKPSALKNSELKFWLQCRGDSLKGLKTKAQLVKRVEEYISRGLEGNIVDPDKSMMYTKRKLQQLRMATTTMATSMPSTSSDISTPTKHTPKFPTNGWGTSLSKAPFFSRVEIDKHIKESGKNVGGGSYHTVPTGLMRAKAYLKDEYLHEIQTAHDQRYFFYRAKCFHSFKKNESPHELKLALCVVSGDVIYAYCGPACAAGKSGFCNHILALMLKVCKFSLFNCQKVTDLKHEDDENPSSACTSSLQQWHQPRVEGIAPQPVMEIVVMKTHAEEKKTDGVQCKLYEARKQQQSNVVQFLEAVKGIDPTFGLVQTCKVDESSSQVPAKFGSSPAGSFGSYQLSFQESNFTVTSSFEPSSSSHTFTIPTYPSFPLDDLNDNYILPVPEGLDSTQKKLLDSLTVSLPNANKLEQETIEQSSNDKWVQARKLRFTASRFGKVARRKRHFEKFCSDQINAKPFKSRSTEHGVYYEPIAKREYQKYMEKIGHPVSVKQSGFFVSPKLYILGCSPDGKVIDINAVSNGDPFGLLEIKCPSSKFTVTPTDACSDQNFCLEIQGDTPKLKKNHEYYDQVQGQMGLTGAKWCDFVVYTKVGMSVERITFDQDHWEKLREILCSFYLAHFLPVAAKLSL